MGMCVCGGGGGGGRGGQGGGGDILVTPWQHRSACPKTICQSLHTFIMYNKPFNHFRCISYNLYYYHINLIRIIISRYRPGDQNM